MHVIDKITQARGKTLLSFEILPPAIGRDNLKSHYDLVGELMVMEPAFINITYHSRLQKRIIKSGDEFVLVPVKKRPGTVGICSSIKTRFHVDTIPHLICTDHDVNEIEDKLIELNYLGIDNILALRGDKLKHEVGFNPKPGGHRYAVDLVRQVKRMNEGHYIDEHPGIHDKTNFCIGVAGYPEKHLEAPSYEEDLRYLKEKVDAGADYVVTQMFFDNQVYFQFVNDCRKRGIEVPIIPGLKNLTRASQVELISKTFGASIPEELKESYKEVVEKKKSGKDTREEEETIGYEWCVRQSQELKAYGVPVIHYYTMGKAEQVKKIVKVVFPSKE